MTSLMESKFFLITQTLFIMLPNPVIMRIRSPQNPYNINDF